MRGRLAVRGDQYRAALRRHARGDVGSAVVEFVLVTPLLVLLAIGVLQVALTLHLRSTVTLAAEEGARAAALAGADPAAGVRRTRELLSTNVAAGSVREVTAAREVVDGLPVITVRVTATLPLVGLLGPVAMEVEGHALREEVR